MVLVINAGQFLWLGPDYHGKMNFVAVEPSVNPLPDCMREYNGKRMIIDDNDSHNHVGRWKTLSHPTYMRCKRGFSALLHALAQRTTEIILREGYIILLKGCITLPDGCFRPKVDANPHIRADNALRNCYAVISEGVKLTSTEQKTFIISLGFF